MVEEWMNNEDLANQDRTKDLKGFNESASGHEGSSEHVLGSLDYWRLGQFVPVSKQDGRYYGGFQGWLTQEGISKFYADRSCGVTAAANAMYYMARQKPGQANLYDRPGITQSEFSAYQKEVYSYLSPAIWGIPTLETMATCVETFATAKGVLLKAVKASETWNEKNVRDYIAEGLNKESPVLLLTWNSPIPDLRLHWVTVTRLYEKRDGIKMVASNWAGFHTYDFSTWVNGSSLYKGVLYFE